MEWPVNRLCKTRYLDRVIHALHFRYEISIVGNNGEKLQKWWILACVASVSVLFRGSNSSVFLCSETARKRLLRRLDEFMLSTFVCLFFFLRGEVGKCPGVATERKKSPTSAAPMGRSPVNTATSFAKCSDRLRWRFVSKYIKSRIKLPRLCPVLNGKGLIFDETLGNALLILKNAN